MGSGVIGHLHAPYQTGLGRGSENQGEKAQQHEHAHDDDPSLLKFPIDRRLGCGSPADLVAALGAELGVIPDFGPTLRAPAMLVLIAEAFEVFRTGAEVAHGCYSGYLPRLMSE